MGSLEDVRRQRTRTFDTIAAVVLTVGIIGLLREVLVGRYGLSWTYIASAWPIYLRGAWVTFYVTTVAYIVGMGIGFIIGWARAARVSVRKPGAQGAAVFGVKYTLRRMGDGYVAAIRGTPLFVQIVFVSSVLVIRFSRLYLLSTGLVSKIVEYIERRLRVPGLGSQQEPTTRV